MTIILDVTDFNAEFFGRNLKRRRESKGFSTSELARRADVSKQYISALERAQVQTLTGRATRPALDKVERLAKALDWDLDEARVLAGYELSPEQEAFDSEGLFKRVERLSPEMRRIAERQIRAIIDGLAEEDHDFDYIDDND